MLLYHLDDVFKCFLSFFVIVLLVAFTAYRINERRAPEDPRKRYYHPGAILLAPFIAIVVIPLAIAAFILAALLYAVFILVFSIMLVTLRRPFLFIWWNRFSTLVGEPLLRIGTSLILLPLRMVRPRPVAQQAMA